MGVRRSNTPHRSERKVAARRALVNGKKLTPNLNTSSARWLSGGHSLALAIHSVENSDAHFDFCPSRSPQSLLWIRGVPGDGDTFQTFYFPRAVDPLACDSVILRSTGVCLSAWLVEKIQRSSENHIKVYVCGSSYFKTAVGRAI